MQSCHKFRRADEEPVCVLFLFFLAADEELVGFDDIASLSKYSLNHAGHKFHYLGADVEPDAVDVEVLRVLEHGGGREVVD